MKKHADAKIVQDFGGPTVLANLLGLDRRVTQNWTVRGISGVGKYKLRDLAVKTKVKLPAGFLP
jgi:hypothetical protein